MKKGLRLLTQALTLTAWKLNIKKLTQGLFFTAFKVDH